MKTLSIMQPWSWLIVNGHKDIENRTWPTKVRGKVLIHASKKFDGDPEEWDWPKIEKPKRFYMGGIVGMAEILDCVEKSDSPWFMGKFGFVIGCARPLPFMPVRGQLGFFDVKYDTQLLNGLEPLHLMQPREEPQT